MITQLLKCSLQSFATAAKPKSVRQRVKFYSRFPDKFRKVTRIRPPDLTDPQLEFPIHVPVRVRHRFHLKKQLITPDSTHLRWAELTPNQILMGFQNIKYLNFKEIVQGLKFLADIKGQEKHDWNQHQWVSHALHYVRDNMNKIKTTDIMHFYFLMKKLNYNNPQFWQKMYKLIEQNYYDFYPGQFQYLYLTYYDKAQSVFTNPQTKKNFDKLMQGRLRQFSTKGIIQIFQKYIQTKKLDNYWLQNVFVGLFKNKQYTFSASQIAKIFRLMMVVGHENNERLYDNLYQRIKNLEFDNLQDIELLEEVLGEVKEIFTSHRVDPTLQVLDKKKAELIERKKTQVKKKSIQQMVKDDLKYFIEKRKIKNEQKQKISTQSNQQNLTTTI